MSRGPGCASITVLCPMAFERAGIAAALRRLGPHSLELIQTGVGATAVARAVDHLATRAPLQRPSLVILAGLAGGLVDPGRLPDVPWIHEIVDGRGRRWAQPLPDHFTHDSTPVILAAVDRIVATPTDKRALAARTGASIVDMESHGFIDACERHALPWRIVRAVSDTVDQTLPPQTLRWLTPSGDSRPARAAIDLLRRPHLIPHIIPVLRRGRRVLSLAAGRVALLAAAWRGGTANALPIPFDAAGLLLYGGTFDPPHRAHIELAAAARDAALGPDAWLVFVPAARNPLKAHAPGAPDAARAAMLRAAAAGLHRSAVWTEELERAARTGEPSYWADTLQHAAAKLPPRMRPRFLIGADQAIAFARWRDPERILHLADPMVLLREPWTTPDLLIDAIARATPAPDRHHADRWRAWIAPSSVPLIHIASTRLREQLAAPTDHHDLARLLHPAVLAIIQAQGLYRSPGIVCEHQR